MLDALEKLTKQEKDVSFRAVLEAIGHRSFGPLLLLAGLVIAAPGVGDLPGIPTGVGIFVILIAGQMILRRTHAWLPKWLLDRSVSDRLLSRSVAWLRTPARALDLAIRKRLVQLTSNSGAHAIAIACVAIALATPLMEVVPLTANIAGAAIAAFGLALAAHDGLLALIAFALTATVAGAIGYSLLG